MPIFTFNLPDIGEGIAEAEIVAWHVKVGDKISEDQPLADMMTDKATAEMESPARQAMLSPSDPCSWRLKPRLTSVRRKARCR